MERLDKILSNFGNMTRTQAKEYLKKGRITVNNLIVKDGSLKVSDDDGIGIDGKTVNRTRFRYFMLNKPSGYISSTEDEPDGSARNVISLFECEKIKGLFPVGRLDKDTTGLLLVTNDGELGHRLTSPSAGIDKTYVATVKGILSPKDTEAFDAGMEFKDFTAKPAKLEIIETNEKEGCSVARVTISEGKFHQVKRMFLKVGCEVTALKRISEGKLMLDESLKQGEYRELSQDEIGRIKE